MRDIGTGNLGNRNTEFSLSCIVVSKELGEVVNAMEETDPAVISSLME
jgi:hypothetical protein